MGSILGSQEAKYCVVQFLTSDYANHFIVPISWILHQTNKYVVIFYPDEDLAKTQIRVESNASCSNDWNLMKASVTCYADSYESALQTLQDLNDVSAKSNISSGTETADDKIDEIETSIKHMVLDENVTPTKSERVKDEKNNTGNKEKSDEKSNEEYSFTPKRTIKSPYKKSPDCELYDSKNTLRYPNLVELVSDSNVYIDAEDLKHCNSSSNDLNQLTIALMRAVFTDEALVRHLLTSRDLLSKPVLDEKATTAVIKYVSEIEGEKWKHCTPLNLKPKDPKDTLIYCNLVKLIPISNVLVNKSELEECIVSSKGVRNTLTRALMRAIFTEEALMNCSVGGQDAVGFDRSLSDTRPGLDAEAVDSILLFVEKLKNTDKIQWDAWDKKSVKSAMNYELRKWRP